MIVKINAANVLKNILYLTEIFGWGRIAFNLENK